MRKGGHTCLSERVVLGPRHQDSNPAIPLGLLCMPGEGPRRRPTEHGDELAPPHIWMAPAVQEVIGGVMHVSLATTILARAHLGRPIGPFDNLRKDERVCRIFRYLWSGPTADPQPTTGSLG